MIDEELRAVVLAVALVAGVLAASQTLQSGRVVEPFSEIGLLGSGLKIGDYPKNVLVNETFRLYLYIGNHEGRVMYYTILVKLGDGSTLINETTHAEAPVIDMYEAILPQGHNTTIPVDLRLPKPATNARLIFELWRLDEGGLRYHGRWLQLWMNVTAPRAP